MWACVFTPCLHMASSSQPQHIFGAGYLFADYEAISTGPSSSLSEIIFVDPQKGLFRLNTKLTILLPKYLVLFEKNHFFGKNGSKTLSRLF